jgi:hypothetical protein
MRFSHQIANLLSLGLVFQERDRQSRIQDKGVNSGGNHRARSFILSAIRDLSRPLSRYFPRSGAINCGVIDFGIILRAISSTSTRILVPFVIPGFTLTSAEITFRRFLVAVVSIVTHLRK